MFQPGVEFNQQLGGWIEVVCGPMFSGKTEELIRRMRRAQIAGQKVEIFKPVSDVRYDDEEVVSHDKNSIPSMPVESSSNMLLLADDVQVVGIDEAQFFDDGIVEVVNTLANQGKRVVIAGLDKDFKGRPFGPMPSCSQPPNMSRNSTPFAAERAAPLTSRIEKLLETKRSCWVKPANMSQ